MSAAKPAPQPSSPFAAWKADHAALRVPDFDAALAWYVEKLDFRLTKRWELHGMTFAWLSQPGDNGFTVELLAGPGAAFRAEFNDLAASYKIPGWHHVCFHVQSTEAAISELRRRGVTIVSEPHDVAAAGIRVGFFSDPWGNVFELVEHIDW
jgi:catechol 2,3-dioxygenase-like lactoylglutathione lyase family enzyme